MKNIFIIFALIVYLGSSVFSSDLKKVTLQLQWKHQFEFAGFYAAKEKGYYKDAGLDVNFIEYETKDNIISKVLNGKADFGLTYTSLIAEYLKGKDITFVANYFKQSPLVIVAQKDITTPAMLRGKKVMGISDTIDDITLKLMLEKFDISLKDIKHIPTSYSIDQFAQKKVDAMALFTTNEIYELDKLGIKYNVFNPSLYGEEYYDVNLFTSKELSLKDPDLVRKFKKASNQGWKYALNHKEEIVKLIQQKYNTLHKTKEALLFEARQIEQLMFTKTEKIGDIDPLRVRLIAKNFVESGYVSSSYVNKLNSFIFDYSNNNLQKKIALTKKEKAFLKKHPKIILGTGDSWEPYSIKREDGAIVGYDQDILDLINKLTGANFVLKLGDWGHMQKLAKEKKIDGLATLTIKEERKSFLNFSDVYAKMVKNIYVKQGNPKNIHSLKDLEGKTISVDKSNLADIAFAKSIKGVKIIYAPTQLDMLKELIYGEADATSGNGATEYMMAKLGLPYIKNVFALDQEQNLHFAIRKGLPEAISILNKALHSIPQDERIRIHSKWFSQVNNFNKKQSLLTVREKKYLNTKNSITMCVDPDWEPYEKIDKDSNHVGLAADYIQLIEQKIDKKMQLIKTESWKESLEFAKEGKCEILSFLNQTPGRDKFLNFTPAMYREPEVIVAKDNVTYLDGIVSLAGKTVGVVQGYRDDEYISKHYPHVKIKYIKNYEDGIKLVSEGKLYATVNSLLGTAYLIRKSNLIDVKIAGKTELVNSYKIGVIKDEPLLLSILSKAVSSITEKQKDKMLSNWISVKFEQGYDYELFWKLLFVVFIIFLLFAYKQRTTRKLNNELKKQVKNQVNEIIEKDRMIFQQNKLASMGEMIENIAHQWRQPLSQVNAAVMTIDSIAYDSGCLTNEMEKELSDIENATQYMSKTIDDFREFISPNNSQEFFSVYDTFNQCLSIIAKPLEYNSIEVQIDIDQSLKVKGSPSEFLQVLMIVLNNAKDAIISNEIQKGKIVVKGYKENKSIIVSINDNAGGINEDILDKIFEPYFTTKHQSQGTGLGLYISKMIIEGKFNGKLWIENRNSGACILMKLNQTKGINE